MILILILLIIIGLSTWSFRGQKLLKVQKVLSPGATILPIRANYQNGNLIWFSVNKNRTKKSGVTKTYINEIKNSLAKAKSNLAGLGPCGIPDYGYETLNPCLYLKLNKISDWSPGKFEEKSSIPEGTPKQLKESIDVNRTTVWFYCDGTTNFDKDNVLGVKYFPENVFEDAIFSDKVKGRNIIAFQVSVKTNYIIALSCTLVGKNIDSMRNKFQSLIFIREI